MLHCLVPIAGEDKTRLMTWLTARCDLPNLAARLLADEVGAYLIAGTDAALVLSVANAVQTSARGLWIEALGGKASWAPKRNARLIRSVLADCELIALASQCTEIRIEAGTRTALKHRLFKAFGFEIQTVQDTTIMRKAL